MGKRKNHVVVPGLGPACPRCRRPTQIREHRSITAKHLRQPFYYTRWYRCMHRDCATTLIMPERFKVWITQEPEPVSPQLEFRLEDDIALQVLATKEREGG
jgi:hypothetical protein